MNIVVEPGRHIAHIFFAQLCHDLFFIERRFYFWAFLMDANFLRYFWIFFMVVSNTSLVLPITSF